MHLRKKKVKDRIYLSIVKAYRDKDGKTKSKTVKTIGYADNYSDKYKDPIAHFTKVAKDMTEQENKINAPINIKLYPKKRINRFPGNQLEIGSSIPSKYFHYDLGIWDFFERRRAARKFKADPGRILELLVWNRLTNPGSKKQAFENKDRFPRKCDFSLDDMYRTLSYLNRYSKDLVDNINFYLEKNRGKRNLKNIYYDVTNYFFEIEEEDGFRMRGVSKEHRPNPIVQMGLMLDNDGIPYNYEIFEGNTNDCLTMLPVMKKCGMRNNKEKVIVVADKGVNCSDNIAACILDNNGYIFSQSVRKATKELKKWVLDDEDYVSNEDESFKIKSRFSQKTIYVENENGKKIAVEVPVKEISYWSRKYMLRSRNEREKIIEKSMRAVNNNYAHLAHAHSSYKYTKETPVVESTGEVVKNIYEIDEEKIKADSELDGYYCLVTSEIDMDEHDVIEAYRGLWKIEESFRVTKTNFSARPVYVSREDHIRAHFLVCYIALLIMRLIQKDTKSKYSATEISNCLKNIIGHRIETNIFHCDYWSKIAEDMCKATGFDLNHEVFTKNKLQRLCLQLKIIKNNLKNS